MIGTRAALRSLQSEVCPACNGTKKPKRSICTKCWRRLPPQQRSDLYMPLMDGYEGALDAALTTLGVSDPFMPMYET